MNLGWEPSWKNWNQYKYSICYNNNILNYQIDTWVDFKFSFIIKHIKSKEIGEQIIKEMKNDLDIIFDIK